MSNSTIDAAINIWKALLGAENVIDDRHALHEIEGNTYHHEVKVPLILMPKSKAEVAQCLSICHQFNIPFYPISKGKNWGLGSASPVQTGSVVISLGKLNEIVEYDEELAFVRIQPGVTFQQLYHFLQDHNSRLMLDVTGADGDTSIIGNALERGHGLGMLSDRASNVVDFEVILSDGTI